MAYMNGKQIMNVVASVENGRIVEIENKIETLETDVETIKQGYVTVDYVDATFVTGETVDQRINEYHLNNVQDVYATKEYVDGLVGDIETLLGGI